jgi:hypothetical protein
LLKIELVADFFIVSVPIHFDLVLAHIEQSIVNHQVIAVQCFLRLIWPHETNEAVRFFAGFGFENFTRLNLAKMLKKVN